MQVIDVDSHSEPRRKDYVIDPQYEQLAPRVLVDFKGTRRKIFNNRITQIFLSGEKGLKFDKHPSGSAAYYDGSVRYQEVTEAGIDFQFVSAGNTSLFFYIEAEAGAAFCKAYNDFIYKTFVKPYPETFGALPLVPVQDLRLAKKELDRCVKHLGVRCLLMPTNWNGIDMADPHWWSFYDDVRELGITTLMVHVEAVNPASKWIGKERVAVLGPDGTRGRRIVSTPFENCANVVNLVFGGMLDAFPDFKIIFLEGGTEFIIGLKKRTTETVTQLPYLADKLSQPLERYFERLYFLVDDHMLEDDGRGMKHAIEELGADHLVFGSDYPHESESLQMCAKLKKLTGIPMETKEKILGGNLLLLLDGRLV